MDMTPPYLRGKRTPLGRGRSSGLDPNRVIYRRKTFHEMELEDLEWFQVASTVYLLQTYRFLQGLETKSAHPGVRHSSRVYSSGPYMDQPVKSLSTIELFKEIERVWAQEEGQEVKSVRELRRELEELLAANVTQGQMDKMESLAQNQYVPSDSSERDMLMSPGRRQPMSEVNNIVARKKRNANLPLIYGLLWEVDHQGFPLHPEPEPTLKTPFGGGGHGSGLLPMCHYFGKRPMSLTDSYISDLSSEGYFSEQEE